MSMIDGEEGPLQPPLIGCCPRDFGANLFLEMTLFDSVALSLCRLVPPVTESSNSHRRTATRLDVAGIAFTFAEMKPKNKSKSKDKATSSPSTSTPKKDHLKNPSHPYTFEHLHNAYITSLSHANTMPFTKKRKSAADSDVDEVPTTKRGKGASGNAFRPSSKVQTDADGNKYWEIAKTRRVTISEFKGQTMVGIREYYEKDGQWLPGKKGISLTLDQYSALIQITPQIEDLLKSQGEKVPRPNYSRNSPTEDDNQTDDEGGQKDVKPNIDATSDEDE